MAEDHTDDRAWLVRRVRVSTAEVSVAGDDFVVLQYRTTSPCDLDPHGCDGMRF